MSDNAEDEAPSLDVWADPGRVSMVIIQASVIEYDGGLAPGLAFTPCQAIEIAEVILSKAREALESDED